LTAPKTVTLDGSDVQEAQDWVAYTLGAAIPACFADQGDDGRNERSRWAAQTLYLLFPFVVAAFTVARQHPEEFKAAVGKPVDVEPMP